MEDRQSYTLTDAARILGTSEGALRQRVRRGTVESYKDHGRVYVYLPHAHKVQDEVHTHESQTLISAQHLEAVEARVELLEQELERAHERDRETRRLLAAALERIPPQLEAPSEERGSAVAPPPQTGRDMIDQEPPARLPLWAYGLGVFLVGATDPLIQTSPSWFPGNPNIRGGGYGNTDATVGPLIFIGVLPESVKSVLAFLLPLLIPVSFGYVVGWRVEGPKIWRWEVTSRFWWRVVVTWLLIAALSFIPWSILDGLLALGFGLPYRPITPWGVFELSAWSIPVGVAFFSGALIGNARRQRVTRQVGSSIFSPRVQNNVGIVGLVVTGIFQVIAAYVGNAGTG